MQSGDFCSSGRECSPEGRRPRVCQVCQCVNVGWRGASAVMAVG